MSIGWNYGRQVDQEEQAKEKNANIAPNYVGELSAELNQSVDLSEENHQWRKSENIEVMQENVNIETTNNYLVKEWKSYN